VVLSQARELANLEGDSSRFWSSPKAGAFRGTDGRSDLGFFLTGSVSWLPSFFSNMEMRALVGAMGAVSVRSRLVMEPAAL
jgi:hypothetical protein